MLGGVLSLVIDPFPASDVTSLDSSCLVSRLSFTHDNLMILKCDFIIHPPNPLVLCTVESQVSWSLKASWAIDTPHTVGLWKKTHTVKKKVKIKREISSKM